MEFQIQAIVLLVLLIFLGIASADPAKDREECAEQLAGLATCLPYVGGQANAPTPDCCSGLKQVLKNNKKCLCVVIRDRNNPDLGLSINVTFALRLPSVCHASANVSKCPELLHMDPKSPEAQVFYQLTKGSSHGAASPAPVPAGAREPMSAESTGASSSPKMDSSNCSGKRWVASNIAALGGLLWYFSSHMFI